MASPPDEHNLGPAFFALGIVGGFLGVLLLAFAALIWNIDGDYVAWPHTPQDQTANQAAVGETLANRAGCLGCHTIDGSPKTGPTWLGLAGSERVLRTGETAIANSAYLRSSIVDPAAQVAEGYQAAIMPTNYATQLSSSEIDALVAYIESLAQEVSAQGS